MTSNTAGDIEKVIIYGTPSCTYCKRAIMVCNTKSLNVEYKELDKDITREEAHAELGEFRTVPQIIVVEGKERRHVGGFTEFYEFLKDFK